MLVVTFVPTLMLGIWLLVNAMLVRYKFKTISKRTTVYFIHNIIILTISLITAKTNKSE